MPRNADDPTKLERSIVAILNSLKTYKVVDGVFHPLIPDLVAQSALSISVGEMSISRARIKHQLKAALISSPAPLNEHPFDLRRKVNDYRPRTNSRKLGVPKSLNKLNSIFILSNMRLILNGTDLGRVMTLPANANTAGLCPKRLPALTQPDLPPPPLTSLQTRVIQTL